MSTIRASTLKKLKAFPNIDLMASFPDLPHDLWNDEKKYLKYSFELTPIEEKTIDSILGKMCLSHISTQINATKNAIEELKSASFRQSRNAFGSASGFFGATGLFLTNVVSWGIITNAILLGVPFVLIGVWIYLRGRREEKQMNQEYEADLFEKTISLYVKQKTFVELNDESKSPLPISLPPSQSYSINKQLNTNKRCKEIKSYKEKRSLIGNPLSHFFFPTLTTIGMCYTLIKMGMCGGLVVAGGPVAWGITLGIACSVGLYFSYKRYKHLQKKTKVETHMGLLSEQETMLDQQIEKLIMSHMPGAALSESETYKNVFTSLGIDSYDFPSSVAASIVPVVSQPVVSHEIPTVRETLQMRPA